MLRARDPARKHVLLIGSGINFIDVAGADLLEREAETQRAAGGALYLCNLKPAVIDVLERGGFVDRIGRDHIFASKDEAIRAIYPRLDSAICRDCTARIFVECRSACRTEASGADDNAPALSAPPALATSAGTQSTK